MMVDLQDTTLETSFHVHEADSHCVFRRASSWFALPALAVREVVFRPELVAVPDRGEMITGMCHLRSEFLAVVNLNRWLTEEIAANEPEPQMIVVNGPDGPWALLVDEVDSLAVLETTAVSGEHGGNGLAGVVVARAVRGSQIVQVLDPNRVYDAAGQR